MWVMKTDDPNGTCYNDLKKDYHDLHFDFSKLGDGWVQKSEKVEEVNDFERCNNC